MSLFSSRTTAARPVAGDLLGFMRRLRRSHLDRKASRASLERLLACDDDHLLQDVGLDRETAHRLLGETLVVPHRAWDRWQL